MSQNGVKDLVDAATLKRAGAGRHLIQNHAERKQISAAVERFLRANLLR